MKRWGKASGNGSAYGYSMVSTRVCIYTKDMFLFIAYMGNGMGLLSKAFNGRNRGIPLLFMWQYTNVSTHHVSFLDPNTREAKDCSKKIQRFQSQYQATGRSHKEWIVSNHMLKAVYSSRSVREFLRKREFVLNQIAAVFVNLISLNFHLERQFTPLLFYSVYC